MHINLETTDIYYLITGFLLASIIFFYYSKKMQKEIKGLKRQYEKKSIGADDKDLKVKALENKIKTLEIALKKQSEQ